MLVDMEKNHPGHNRTWVFLDDVRQRFVIMADSKLGVMEQFAVDARGRFMLDERGEKVKTITKRGRVRIFDSRSSDFGKWEDA